MASHAQILANQANARQSPGPRSPQGKAASAVNSLKEGFTARFAVVPAGEEQAFAAFRDALLADTRPEGALEEEFFSRLLTYGWNLRRARAAESSLLATVDFEDEAACARLFRVARYRRDLERSHDRALRELRHIQTQRAVLLQQPHSVIADFSSIAPLADLTRITLHTDPLIHGMNTGFRLPQLSLAASREQARAAFAESQAQRAAKAAAAGTARRNEAKPCAAEVSHLVSALSNRGFSDAEKMAVLDEFTRPPVQAA